PGCSLGWGRAAVGAPGRHRLLEKELRELQAAERQLDDLIQMCTLQLRLLTEDPANQQYPLLLGWAYVTCQDLRSIVDPAEQMVMVIKAPPETQLQVSDPSEVSWGHTLLLVLWDLELLFTPTEALLPGPSTLPSKSPEEEVSLSPLASMDMLLEQREDLAGFLGDEFINLSPPQAQDYHFGLEEGEGISELFDCNFGDFTPLDF
uniref:E2F transcription factor 1 n=1 Tax=Zosterops lateralis melanops TaxID=1220523 RepID=A0A8D2NXH8_ZOSLA